MVDYGITRGGTITGPVTISGSAPTGKLLYVKNTASAPSDHTVVVEGVNATDRAIGLLATGDTQDRHNMTIAGLLQWGSGAAGLDTNLYRAAANALQTDDPLTLPAPYIETSSPANFTLAAQTASALTVAAVATGTYRMDCMAVISNATGTTTISWTGPAGATMQWNDTTTSTDYAATIGATNTYASSASTRMALFSGIFKTTGTAGNLTMTIGVSAGTTVLAAGSNLSLQRRA